MNNCSAVFLVLLCALFLWPSPSVAVAQDNEWGEPRLVLQVGHDTSLGAVTFSPDGRQIYSADAGGRVICWDTASGREVWHVEITEPITSLAVSAADGLLACGTSHGRVRLLDTRTGASRGEWTENAVVSHLLWAPHGHLAVATHSGWIVERDPHTGTALRTLDLRVGKKGLPTRMAFSSDGVTLLAGGGLGRVALFDWPSGEMQAHVSIAARAFSGVGFFSGQQVMVATTSGQIHLLQQDLREVGTLHEPTAAAFDVTAMSADGRWMVAKEGSFGLRLWDLEQARWVRILEDGETPAAVAAFGPRGRLLVVGGQNGGVALWDLQDGTLQRRLRPWAQAVEQLHVSGDGRRLTMAVPGSLVRVWDLEKGELLPLQSTPRDEVWRPLAISASGERLVTVNGATQAGFWTLEPDPGWMAAVQLSAPLQSAAWSLDDERVLLGGRFGAISSWNAADQQLSMPQFVFNGAVHAVTWLGSGTAMAAVGGCPAHLKIWSSFGDPTAQEMGLGDACGRIELTVSPDTHWLASTNASDGTIFLLDLDGRESRRLPGGDSLFSTVVFSSDSRWIAAGDKAGEVYLWDVVSGASLAHLPAASPVKALAFAPDGRWLAVGHDDRWVRLWGLNARGDPTHPVDTSFLGQLAISKGADWVVMDGDGRFDARGGSYSAGVHWVLPDESGADVIFLSSLRRQRRSPELLRGMMGQPSRASRKVPSLQHIIARDALRPPLPQDADAGRPPREFPTWTGWADDPLPAHTIPEAVPPPQASGTAIAHIVHQIGRDDPVLDVVASDDGRYLATGSESGKAFLWEASSGRLLRVFQQQQPAMVVALSPDGTVLAVNCLAGIRLWSTISGDELGVFDALGKRPTRMAFSSDGQRLLSAHWGGDIFLWRVEDGAVLFHHEEPRTTYTCLGFTPDERAGVACSDEGTLWTFNLDAGTVQEQVELSHPLYLAELSPGARYVLGGSQSGPIRVFLRETGEEVWSFSSPYGDVALTKRATWAPDRRHVALADKSGVAFLVDLETGREVHRFERHDGPVTSLVVTPDDERLVTASDDGTARLWDMASGDETARLQRRARSASALAVSPAGDVLVIGFQRGGGLVWDLRAGRPSMEIPTGEHHMIKHMDFAPDGHRLALVLRSDLNRKGKTDRLAVLDLRTGALRLVYEEDLYMTCARFTPAGDEILLAGLDHDVRVIDVETGTVQMELEGPRHAEGDYTFDSIWSLASSADGSRVFASRTDGRILVWRLEDGKRVGDFTMGSNRIRDLHLSADGSRLFTHDETGRVAALDAHSGAMLQVLLGHGPPGDLVISPSGDHLLFVNQKGRFYQWDGQGASVAPSPEMAQKPLGHACFIPGGHLLFGVEDTGSVVLMDLDSGTTLANLLAFQDGTWAVVDEEDRFDASVERLIPGLYWVLDLPAGPESIDLGQLKAHYYEPGLLAKRSGWSVEPLRDVLPVGEGDLPPAVEVGFSGGEQRQVQIRLRDRGGGIGRLALFLNGREIVADALQLESARIQPQPDGLTATLDLNDIETWQPEPGKHNEIALQAFNAAQEVASRGVGRGFVVAARESQQDVELWAIIAGVSDYAGSELDLRYAAADAHGFARALAAGAGEILPSEHIHLTLLESPHEDPDHRVTRANLVAAFQAAREAGPEDLLVIYLAGHGVAMGDDYFFPTAEASADDLATRSVVEARAISSAEILEWSRRVPANKQVLVLDTCHAGAVLQAVGAGRAQGTDWVQRRAIEELKDRMGVFILAGASADKRSFENNRMGHGLLTYSLLSGMRGEAVLKRGDLWDVDTLFDYAVDRVPELASRFGQEQRPVKAVPLQARSFSIGRLTPAVEAAIPLQRFRPVVSRTLFQHKQEIDDVLYMGARVDMALRQRDASPDAMLSFLESSTMDGIYRVAGRYEERADGLAVRVVLHQNETLVGQTELWAANPDALAEEVVTWVEQRVRERVTP